jgi:translation initiation factor 2B subunit (eIF-2B alpha/beta/delta family)
MLRVHALSLWDHAWPTLVSIRQLFRAASQSPGITITNLAAVFSVAFPFLLPREPSPALILGVLAGLLLTTLVSGEIALWTADPQTYARILLAGRPAKEVLFVISRHVIRTCQRTLRNTYWVADISESLEKRTSAEDFEEFRGEIMPEPERRRVAIFQRRLLRHLQRQHKALLRVETLKLLASNELDIPPRRLCDHLFQYSPVMHRERLQKYAENWDEIFNFQEVESAEDARRYRALVVQNRSLINNTLRRLRYQRQILQNRDLHPFIVQFASKHSTSGSLQTYAEALKFVAATGQRSLQKARDSAARERVVNEIEDRLRLLHRKQRAHPGFDLHTLLRRAVGAMGNPTASLVLQGLDDVPSFRISTETPLRQETPSIASPLLQISIERLKPFITLPADLSRLVAASRDRIAQQFERIYGSWFDGGLNARYIVSHGYSKTVLSVLKKSLPPEETPGSPGLPRLFFILTEEGSFDTRVMEYELKQDRSLRRFRNLAAGSEQHLLGLLARGDSVLILLGAECFDKDRRVVHPRGIASGLRNLILKLNRRGIRTLVVVVAESYKCHEKLLNADTKFYGQHFDRIELYLPDLIDIIVSDDRTYPENCDEVIKKRRQGRTSPAPAVPPEPAPAWPDAAREKP